MHRLAASRTEQLPPTVFPQCTTPPLRPVKESIPCSQSKRIQQRLRAVVHFGRIPVINLSLTCTSLVKPALSHTLLFVHYLFKGTGVLTMQRAQLHFVKHQTEQSICVGNDCGHFAWKEKPRCVRYIFPPNTFPLQSTLHGSKPQVEVASARRKLRTMTPPCLDS